jgi:ribosomal protein L7/L12
MHPLVKLVLIVIIVVVAVIVWGRVVGRKDPDRELVGLTDTVRARVSREISAGHKINAIKIYREATGAPLVDAKRAVDSWFVPADSPTRPARASASSSSPDGAKTP